MIMSAQARSNSSFMQQQQGRVENTQLLQALMNASLQKRENSMKLQHQVQPMVGFATAPNMLAPTKRPYPVGATITLAPAAKRQKVHGIGAHVVPQSKGWWKFGDMQRDMIRELIDKDVIHKDASPSVENLASVTAMVPSIAAAYQKPLAASVAARHSAIYELPTTGSLPNNPIQTKASSYYEQDDGYSHDGTDDTSDMDDQAALRFRAYQVSKTNPSMVPSCVCL
jgi:hypothetical protein